MAKGFLSRLMQKLAGAPQGNDAPEVVAEDLKAVLKLDRKWDGDDALIQLGDFMRAYRQQASGVQYFMILSRMQFDMAQGRQKFFYPKPGICDYPERDMLFAEHCYVPVASLVQRAHERGQDKTALFMARALMTATQDREPESAENLTAKGYVFTTGAAAARNFYIGAYEAGGSFATVLRHRDGGGQKIRPVPRVPL